MKKITACLFVLFIAVLFVPRAGAQSVHYGLKGGLNLANMKFEFLDTVTDAPDFKTLTAGAAGFYVNFKLGPVSIQPELLFLTRGTSWDEENDTEVNVKGKIKCSYIELPILIKYSFLSGPARPFLFAGPSFAFLTDCKYGFDVNYTGEEPDYSYYYDFKDYVKKSEFAAVFGAGIDFDLPKFIVSVDARYHLGFSNIAEADLETMMSVTSLKHKGISVMVGIGF